MPLPVKRHARQQPGQLPQRRAIRRLRHQRHRDGQPDRQLQRHDPPPPRRAHPPGGDARRDQALDHSLAQVPLQFPEPDETGQPAAGQHRAAPDHRRGRHHRLAEHHHRARRHRRSRSRGRHRPLPPCRASVQVSRPDRHHPRRRPRRHRARRIPGCVISGRHIRRHEGSWTGWTSTPKPCQEPSPRQNHREPATPPRKPPGQRPEPLK